MSPPFTLRQRFELHILEDTVLAADEREEEYFEAMGRAGRFALVEQLAPEALRRGSFPNVLAALAAVTDPDVHEPFHPTNRIKEYANRNGLCRPGACGEGDD